MPLPILYTFRRCPYAMRARMALAYAGINYEVREVVLRDKPPEMLQASAKGTVPVLLQEGKVIDESLDVMLWALNQRDTDGWLVDEREAQIALLERCEADFKPWLDRYKYADRHPEFAADASRAEASAYLITIETQLTATGAYLFGANLSMADVGLLPFVRQFAHVDKVWFDKEPWPELQRWLQGFLQGELFQSVMQKYPRWQAGDAPTYFATH